MDWVTYVKERLQERSTRVGLGLILAMFSTQLPLESIDMIAEGIISVLGLYEIVRKEKV